MIADVDAFLRPEDAELHAPGAMKSLPDAVELVAAAIGEGRRIAIFGDYDADGVTATMKDGVLTITLPKAKDARPRQIPVKSA